MKLKFSITYALVSVLFLAATIYQKPTKAADPFPVCMGKALAKYMNDVTSQTRGLSRVRLVSPAFNLTNGVEVEMHNAMIAAGANWGALAAVAGNAYSNVGNDYSGYEWYVNNGWKSRFNGKPMIFTEFGDWRTTGPSTPQSILNDMRTDFAQAAADSTVISVNYFNAIGTNPDPNFFFHNIGPENTQSIISGNPKGGINSAAPLSGGTFQNRVAGLGGTWATEIALGPGDIGAVRDAVNNYNTTTVVRLCVGNSCGFSNPDSLVAFINQLDAQVNKPVYVIVGPNEPATEKWVAPECQEDVIDPPSDDEVPCTETTNPENHSLRPYPASPCNRAPQGVYMCSNLLVVKDRYTFNLSDAVPGSCQTLAGGRLRCDVRIQGGSTNVTFAFPNAELPFVGNTEDVPNSTSRNSGVSFRQRVNHYVSWYLNGITYRAEEAPENIVPNERDFKNLPSALSRIINYSGPLKKLLPIFIQEEERRAEASRIGSERHDQIVSCGNPNSPQSCYRSNEEQRNYLSSIANNTDSPSHKYIPFSSTEDLVGRTTEPKFGIPVDDVTRADLTITSPNTSKSLYFAHMQENSELSSLLQKTFVPGGNSGLGGGSTDKLYEFNSEPNCEIVGAITNPGDRLFGNLDRFGETALTANLSYDVNFSCEFDAPSVPNNFLPTCSKEVSLPFSVWVQTPKADELWDRLVDGDMSVFKRFFPKTGPNTPVEEIEHIPAYSTASYDATAQGGLGGQYDGSSVFAGDPEQGRAGSSAQIFFPYLGSLREYFLSGIQQALRPKGIVYEGTADEPGGEPDEDYTVNCDKNAPPPNLGRWASTVEPKSFFEGFLASGAQPFPDAVSIKNLVECYNDLVGRAIARNVDPALALAIWAEESRASNYEYLDSVGRGNVADFGCTVGITRRDYLAQSTCFLNLLSAYGSPLHMTCASKLACRMDENRYPTMLDFMLIFEGGNQSCRENRFTIEPLFPAALEEYYRIVSRTELDITQRISNTQCPL